MTVVNMLQAKTNLSRLVQALETGAETEIVIARNGRPAARLVPLQTAAAHRRIGVAAGLFDMPEDIDAHNDEVASLFGITGP